MQLLVLPRDAGVEHGEVPVLRGPAGRLLGAGRHAALPEAQGSQGVCVRRGGGGVVRDGLPVCVMGACSIIYYWLLWVIILLYVIGVDLRAGGQSRSMGHAALPVTQGCQGVATGCAVFIKPGGDTGRGVCVGGGDVCVYGVCGLARSDWPAIWLADCLTHSFTH